MAFTTTSSRRSKPLLQISSNFNITIWLTAILLTVTVTHVVMSAPTLSTDVSSGHSGNTQDLIGQVFNGLELIIGLGNRLINSSILDIQDFQNVNVSLRTVCNMYELYSHFTTLQVLSTVLPQQALYNADYSSNLFVTWRVMQTACSWAKSSGSSLPLDCTLISIANTCYSFNHRRLVFQDRFEIHSASERPIVISIDQWISGNEVPPAVAECIRNSNA